MGMQRGRGFGNILGSLFRSVIVPAAKSVGKSLVRTGLRKASNVMRGVADGQKIGDAVAREFVPRSTTVRQQQHRRPPATPRLVKPRKPAAQKRKRPQSSHGPRKVAKKDIFSKYKRK